MEASKVIDTPIATATRLDMNESGSPINQIMYRDITGSLLDLTASRPNIVFSVGLCARFQSNPKESHLNAAKRILRYLKETQNMVLYYPSGDNFNLIGLLLCSAPVDQTTVGRFCALNMAKNPVQHKRTKHIDVRHHFLKDNMEKGLICMKFCSTEDQIADIFTKALSREHFEGNRLELGLIKPN
uniref:Retrovirus-related Pol polyprotein from transposon TNT 1-94 n=1 Tax=Nicotiana tabacum TaxID=4097 RepID=A0A1S4A1A4_TOBAC|nr:PREDICTED: uncharacterized protein LOC107792737 [Nicotiana tabacum]